MSYIFRTIFINENKSGWTNLVIKGIGEITLNFDLPENLHRLISDYVDAECTRKVVEIQANMTVATATEPTIDQEIDDVRAYR